MRSDQVVIVVGAAAMGSIGHAVAVRAARDGADVVVADIERPPAMIPDVETEAGWTGLAGVVREIELLGRRALAVTCDVTRTDQVRALVAAAEEQGEIAGMVNTTRAPIEPARSSLDMDDDVWATTFDINVRGALSCAKAVARSMMARGRPGSIVHISSLAGIHPLRGRTAYCASKAALNMLTQVMALDLAPAGIRVNAVCPAIIATHRIDPDEAAKAERAGVSLAEQRRMLLAEQSAAIPLGRVGSAEDVADVVGFLLSPASSYVTGQLVTVSGGLGYPVPIPVYPGEH
ncbi:SDR family NAD(P)-dependent oxidoreductase [Dactylosporangium sucinum]|uniref:Diacetyl reductase n=1 Tax=Dactylosporangium sucinum TaxID=1424081 RepID=A0A917TSB2_9ACTN|nr:SDR family oxidoreductase [Dactylosporangium sucinum]GGM35623.1 diacetyl reductase [Dactylosporangium sucinum]